MKALDSPTKSASGSTLGKLRIGATDDLIMMLKLFLW
jgi:hypothetical protein